MSTNTFRFPWQNRRGEFSALKALALACVIAPALWIGWRYFAGQLGGKPNDAVLRETGDWATRLLLVALAVSPWRIITGDNRIIAVRRILGVSALIYVLVHVLMYVVQQRYDLVAVAFEIIKRFYLTIGFVAFSAMLALGLTSTDGAVKRLGAERWSRLHRLVYPIAVLAILHGYIQAKVDVSERVTETAILFALLGVRVMRHRIAITPLTLLALVLAVGVLAIGLEFLWYRLATGVPAERILAANLVWDLQPRPALLAVMILLAMPAIALVTRFGAFGTLNRRARA